MKVLFNYYQELTNLKKPKNLTGVQKTHLKCNCVDVSNLDGIRHPIFLYLFALDKPPGHKI